MLRRCRYFNGFWNSRAPTGAEDGSANFSVFYLFMQIENHSSVKLCYRCISMKGAQLSVSYIPWKVVNGTIPLSFNAPCSGEQDLLVSVTSSWISVFCWSLIFHTEINQINFL